MRRREFIILGGSAAAWPVGARAQQKGVPLIGFLNTQSAESFSHLVAGFQQGLREAGFLEGQNIQIEHRWAEGRYDRGNPASFAARKTEEKDSGDNL